MTADDLTRLRDVAEAATPGPWRADENDSYVWVKDDDGEVVVQDIPLWADARFIATFDPPTVAALIDRVERAERERDQWKDRMWVSVRERAVWSHEAGQHAGDIPFHHCPICEASFHRDELAALRAAVAGLADNLASWAANWQLTEAVEKSRRDLAADLLTKASEGARALLTEGADDGQ